MYLEDTHNGDTGHHHRAKLTPNRTRETEARREVNGRWALRATGSAPPEATREEEIPTKSNLPLP